MKILLIAADLISLWIGSVANLDFIGQLMKPADTSELEFYPVDSKIVKSKENNPEIEKQFKV